MTQDRRIQVLAVDYHPVVREGLAAIINDQPDMRVVAEANSGPQAIELFRFHLPDIVITDLRLPGMSGVEVTRAICRDFPGSKVLVLTTFDGDEDIHQAFQAGARGYLLKSVPRDDLIDAIHMIHSGSLPLPPLVAARLAERVPAAELTARECEVLNGVIQGRSNKEIAARLLIGEGTVKAHVNNIMRKLHADNRTQAVVTALRRGIVHLDQITAVSYAAR